MNKRLAVALLAIFGTSQVYANGGATGFHFYIDPIVEEEKPVTPKFNFKHPDPNKSPEETKRPKKTKEDIVRVTPPKQVKERKPEEISGTAEWYYKENERLTKLAVADPSEENVMNHIVMERVLNDKANLFAVRKQELLLKNPQLMVGVPVAQGGVNIAKENVSSALNKVYKELTDKAVVFFMFESSCPHCHKMANTTIRQLQADGYIVKGVSVDGKGIPNSQFSEPGSFAMATQTQLEMLQVNTVPATFLFTANQGMAPLTVGYTAFSEFKERMALVARESGLISKEDYEQTKYTNLNDNLIESKVVEDKIDGDYTAEDLLERVKKRLRLKHR